MSIFLQRIGSCSSATGRPRCGFSNVALKPGAVLWALRSNFEDRTSAIAELHHAGVLLAPEISAPAGQAGSDDLLVLVVRPEATKLRDAWRDRALNHAEAHASLGRWSSALAASEQAFALATEIDARILGLLVLSYEQQQRGQRAEGYLRMAERSKGLSFRQEVEAHREQWLARARLASADLKAESPQPLARLGASDD